MENTIFLGYYLNITRHLPITFQYQISASNINFMLTVITGPMFSGKSIELIRRINRERVAGKRVCVIKFGEDDRYSKEHLASYDGYRSGAISATTTPDIIERGDPLAEVIVIDEVQFFDDAIIDWIMEQVAGGRKIICAGLNLDFRGEPFPFGYGSVRTMADLIVRADNILKLSSICTFRDTKGVICGVEATRTQRLKNNEPANWNEPTKQIGAQESYEARCVEHHFVPR
ncbi:MAG: Thymidine kinase [Candidatus Magasanikbacteria bacterium]|nr:Thymidine kinase [Candidatus Magasanikbacteria bacterium]